MRLSTRLSYSTAVRQRHREQRLAARAAGASSKPVQQLHISSRTGVFLVGPNKTDSLVSSCAKNKLHMGSTWVQMVFRRGGTMLSSFVLFWKHKFIAEQGNIPELRWREYVLTSSNPLLADERTATTTVSPIERIGLNHELTGVEECDLLHSVNCYDIVLHNSSTYNGWNGRKKMERQLLKWTSSNGCCQRGYFEVKSLTYAV